MASLKEVKIRINTVENIKKVTLAQQLISSAKHHQMHNVLHLASNYKKGLDSILVRILNNIDEDKELDNRFLKPNTSGAVAVVIVSSNSGMCGAFNSNMIKELEALKSRYPSEELLLFPIGRKVNTVAKRNHFNIDTDCGIQFEDLVKKINFDEVSRLADYLIELYRTGKIKRIEMFYYKYKNMARHHLAVSQLLPFDLDAKKTVSDEETSDDDSANYIWEPSAESLVDDIIPMAVKFDLYSAIVNNMISEYAARTIAMQMATENAKEVLEELQLTYNKLRQQNITAELLDIIGSSFA